jgi:hypothetical protein
MNINKIQVNTKYITPELLNASLVFGKNIINLDTVKVNTLLNKIIFKYYVETLKKKEI